MTDTADSDPQQDFARAFGDALSQYLDHHGVGQSEAAELLGLHGKNGKPRRSRLNSYFRDSAHGKRTEASAQVLYLACTKLRGFYFDYAGYRMKAVKLGEKRREEDAEQLAFSFHRQFELAGNAGNLNVRVRRPSGRIELSVSLDANARRNIKGDAA
jgi:hypothetical protein